MIRGQPQVRKKFSNALKLFLDVPVKIAPEIRIAQLLKIDFSLLEFFRSEIEKRADRYERIANVMAEARRQHPEAHHAVGNHEVMQHRELFLQQSVAFLLHNEELQRPAQCDFEDR